MMDEMKKPDFTLDPQADATPAPEPAQASDPSAPAASNPSAVVTPGWTPFQGSSASAGQRAGQTYGYSGSGYRQDGYAQGYQQNAHQQSGYQQNSYQQNGYQQNGYGQGGYRQSGYAQGAYQNPESARMDMNHIPPEPPKKKKKGGIGSKIALVLALGLFFGAFFGIGFVAVKSIANNVTITHESGFDKTPILPKHSDEKKKKEIIQKDEEPEAAEEEPQGGVAETPAGNEELSEIENTAPVSASVMDASDVVENCMPSIVSITELYTQTYRSIWGESGQVQNSASGSGVIVGENDTELLIVTNNHVVANADELTVQFVDGATYDAQIKGTDSDTDLAIIAIEKSELSSDTKDAIKIAVLGDSTTLKVGEPAIAIGNALGYGQSVTCGVISAVDRELPLDGVAHSVIQTDAAINPGNSGGALLNIRGELIGINEAKLATTSVEGMGYAIPISTAKPIIEELMSKTTRRKVEANQTAYLGIGGVDVTDDISELYSMPKGVYVNQIIEGTAADECGLQRGDVITKFDGQSVRTMKELKDMLQYYSAGTEVELKVQRVSDDGYEELTIPVTLGKKTE